MQSLDSKNGRLTLMMVVVLVFLFCTSCGIDTIAYLTEKPVVRDEAALIFKGPNIQNENYYGIFIFYKIYAIETDASNDLSALVAKQNAQNAVPGSNVESFLVSTSGLDYQQLVLDNTLSIPTLDDGDLTSNSLANINFASESNVEPTLIIKDELVNAVVQEFELRRSAISSTGSYVSFLDEPQPGNLDFKTSSNDANVHEYHIQFLAAAYGLDLSDLSELYGDAVYLGRIKRYF